MNVMECVVLCSASLELAHVSRRFLSFLLVMIVGEGSLWPWRE